MDAMNNRISLGTATKLPAIAASDAMALFHFAEALLRGNFPFRILGPALLVGHHVRTPELLAALATKLCESHAGMNRPSAFVQVLVVELNKAPFVD